MSHSRKIPMARLTRSTAVPKTMQPRYDAIIAVSDAVCREHLNEQYATLARQMAAALCRQRPSPVATGQPRTWACGILQVLGRINFLSDPTSQPAMTLADLCGRMGVGESTGSAKARVIMEALDIQGHDTTWMLPDLLANNPLVWIVEVNGLMVDLQHMPREVQVLAFEKGLIPFIPADRT
jgi:hypothetical protein